MTELERKQLLLVEEALSRIRRAEYGRCLNCGVVDPAASSRGRGLGALLHPVPGT